MGKDARIELRVNSLFKGMLLGYCAENKLNVGDFIVLCVLNTMKDPKFKLKLEKRFKKMDLRQIIKEKNADFYFIKNCYTRIMDISTSNYFSTGFVNIKMVKEMIKDYDKLFHALDPKVKKIIKSDWKMLRMKLNDEHFLTEQVENFLNYKAISNKMKQISKK